MDVAIRVLGQFSVTLDGLAVPEEAWSRRGAASLVKVLALADGRRLHREQVMDALWPGVSPDVAGPRLHKAAHYARRALGEDGRGLRLHNNLVVLLPDANVAVDALEFRRRGEAALASGSRSDADEALTLYGGTLLPEDLYEPWATDWREVLAALHSELLAAAGRLEDVLRADPADEATHLALAREYADRGDVRGALRQLERMDQALRRELGTVPSPAAEQFRAELLSRLGGAGGAVPATSSSTAKGTQRLVGRRQVGDSLRQSMDRAAAGRGSAVLVVGPPGIGKSAVLDLAAALADGRGWRIARGGASAVEGSWPYAPVLEALAMLCRRHPTLLDGLDDSYRDELDRALSGRSVTWSGESAHMRLFVAAAELVRLAAAGHGLLLVVDDVHEADDASLRLLHYLARCAASEPVVIVMGARPDATPAVQEMLESLVSRRIGAAIELAPLDETATRRLVAHEFPDLDEETVAEVWAVSGGVPFRALEAARSAAAGSTDVAVSGLSAPALGTFRRVALLGSMFTTDELLAVSGADEDETYRHLEAALATAVVEPADAGYRFRHALVRESLLSGLSARERARAGREVAEQLAELGASPNRVAHLFVAAGHPVQAIPYARPAIEIAGALGAYRDALALLDAVVDHATGEDRGHLLSRRGDLLMALADPAAVDAYRAALSVTTGTEHRLVRARLARTATFQADFDTATAAIANLELTGDAADAPILLARGNLAYFIGDIDGAWEAADEARRLLQPDDPWQIFDLIGLQGLIAHQRGQWFERFRRELRRSPSNPGLTAAVFDAHLCVAEYLLYGQTPYAEVIELATDLRRRAEHYGALRGVAFATALIGEAALLRGDLETAERELTEAADLHRDVDASAGEAHSLQRLAEVRLARGDREGATKLLQQALPLARWSAISMSMHLLQRIYGTMIVAADDSVLALAAVEQGEAVLGQSDHCPFCDVMFAVPAAIAYADAGEVPEALTYLDRAEASRAQWESSAWDGAVAEVRAHIAAARGEETEFARWAALAESLFTAADQPLDAARCAALRANPPAALVCR